jgi:16S rRNA (cytosine1402-N4)-methyltransferase
MNATLPRAAEDGHVPVLLDRVVELLADAPDGPFVDVTLGAGGHAAAVTAARLERHGSARLVGIDRDPDALTLAAERLEALASDPAVTVDLVHARSDRLAEVLDGLGIDRVAAVLADLGTSSMQLDRAERGFSYRQHGPVDMRMDPDDPISASDLVNDWSADDLADVLARLGEERFATRIARAIVTARPITSTTELAEVIRTAIPAATRRTGPHPATRTFQALRIAVNDELEVLERFLAGALGRLAPGGVLVVLSYHSLEDRAVKRAFADAARDCVCPPDLPICACGAHATVEPLVRRAEGASDAEREANPRSASVRLRAVRRLEDAA